MKSPYSWYSWGVSQTKRYWLSVSKSFPLQNKNMCAIKILCPCMFSSRYTSGNRWGTSTTFWATTHAMEKSQRIFPYSKKRLRHSGTICSNAEQMWERSVLPYVCLTAVIAVKSLMCCEVGLLQKPGEESSALLREKGRQRRSVEFWYSRAGSDTHPELYWN